MMITIIEGTPAEIEALPQFRMLLAGAQAPIVTADETKEVKLDDPLVEEDGSPVSAELFKRALLRIPILENQKAVARAGLDKRPRPRQPGRRRGEEPWRRHRRPGSAPERYARMAEEVSWSIPRATWPHRHLSP
jgi:hypothetical protein